MKNSSRYTQLCPFLLLIHHISVNSSSFWMQLIAFESHGLGVFVGVKGVWSGEREVERRCEVIGVWSFLLTPVFLFVPGSGLLPSCDVIPHGREA